MTAISHLIKNPVQRNTYLIFVIKKPVSENSPIRVSNFLNNNKDYSSSDSSAPKLATSAFSSATGAAAWASGA